MTNDTEMFLRTLFGDLGTIRIAVLDDTGQENAGMPRRFDPGDHSEAAAHAARMAINGNVFADLDIGDLRTAVVLEFSKRSFLELASFALPPSIVLQSRWEAQDFPTVYAYWKLDEPCHFSLADDVAKALAKRRGAGAHPPRRTPLPGTLAHIPHSPSMEVRLVDLTEKTCSACALWAEACPVPSTPRPG